MQPHEKAALDYVLTDYCSPSSDVNAHSFSLNRMITGSSSTSSTNLLAHDTADPRRESRWPWRASHKPSDCESLSPSSPTTNSQLKPKMRPWQGWEIVLFGSWLNLLFAFFPASWLVNSLVSNSETLVFIFCVLAMIPLVRLHELATGELSFRLGGAKTGLLNASLSNIIELVVAITALRKCQLRVVQASLIGAMLSKLLLVLGLCFFAGGLRFTQQQGFDPTASQIHSSLLSISVGAVLMPAAYHFSLSGGSNEASDFQKENILKMSRGVSVILLIVYILYLAFQFYSHSYLFKDNSTSTLHEVKNPLHSIHPMRSLRFGSPEKTHQPSSSADTLHLRRSKGSPSSTTSSIALPAPSPYCSASDISLPLTAASSTAVGSINYVHAKTTHAEPAPSHGATVKLVRLNSSPGPATPLPGDTLHPNPVRFPDALETADNSELDTDVVVPRQPRLSYPITILTLIIVAVLVSLNAERLVEALDVMEETNPNISTEWIGLIVLPTVSVIAECITAVNVSRKDQLTLSISVAVGSSIQTALFVIPLMVLSGWVLEKPLALLFDPFESVTLFISVHTMNYVLVDGKSNWLEGALLICLYVIIAVAFWFYPGSTFSSTLAVCAVDANAA